MCGRTAELAVVNHERGSETEQSLYREEVGLAARSHGRPVLELPELMRRMAGCQVEVIRKFGHVREITPAVTVAAGFFWVIQETEPHTMGIRQEDSTAVDCKYRNTSVNNTA